MPTAILRPALIALSLALAPFAAGAVGDDDDQPPPPTPTTAECAEGSVWNPETKVCEAPREGMLDDDRAFATARELNYAGRPGDALAVLATMAEGDSDRVLAVRGFALRSLGRVGEGMAAYEAALARNPDNLLARSYMGQALVIQGRRDAAEVQLAEIIARGGAGGWAEASLRRAIATGQAFRY